MATKYTPEQIDKILQKLPQELHEAIFSMENAQHIWDIREKYGVVDKKGEQIPAYVGYVLMGLILPQEFEELLQKEIKLPKKAAQEIAREINRFVFYPVKPALEQLSSAAVGQTEAKTAVPKARVTQGLEEQAPAQPRGEDEYRESIE